MFPLGVISNLSYMIVAVSVHVRYYLMSLYLTLLMFLQFFEKMTILKSRFWKGAEYGFAKRLCMILDIYSGTSIFDIRFDCAYR